MICISPAPSKIFSWRIFYSASILEQFQRSSWFQLQEPDPSRQMWATGREELVNVARVLTVGWLLWEGAMSLPAAWSDKDIKRRRHSHMDQRLGICLTLLLPT